MLKVHTHWVHLTKLYRAFKYPFYIYYIFVGCFFKKKKVIKWKSIPISVLKLQMCQNDYQDILILRHLFFFHTIKNILCWDSYTHFYGSKFVCIFLVKWYCLNHFNMHFSFLLLTVLAPSDKTSFFRQNLKQEKKKGRKYLTLRRKEEE